MKLILSILLLASPLAALADATFLSPDGKYVATVVVQKNNEIFVRMETKAGSKALAEVNLLSQDSEHGRTLAKAAWSADSKFFVFTTESSGGHSPWHFTTFYYARSAETFRNFDNRTGLSVAAPEFTIDSNDVLHFQKYNFDTALPVPALVSLPRLENVRN